MKKSFTLIEVVFSIVILGIVVTAIPSLLISVGNSAEESLKRESFKNAFTTLELITSVNWDENNTKGDNYYKVLTANDGDSELKCSRIGKEQINNGDGRKCASDDNLTSAIGLDDDENKSDVTTYDDVDDFNGYNVDNLEKYDLNVSVFYIKDETDYSDGKIYFDATAVENADENVKNTNIKMIRVDVHYKGSNEKIAVLKYYSTNIGLSVINGRNF